MEDYILLYYLFMLCIDLILKFKYNVFKFIKMFRFSNIESNLRLGWVIFIVFSIID